MKKKSVAPTPWDIDPAMTQAFDAESQSAESQAEPETIPLARPVTKAVVEDFSFDMEGLMTDFPTAKELEKFVYDQTGVVLNLKGRANKLKYQVAMDVLNGKIPNLEFLGSENPYLDKNELVPVEPPKQLPPRDPAIIAAGPEVNTFHTSLFPHPDPEWKAMDQKCMVQFVKYANGIITYEILGPVAQRAVGTRINKYGKDQPEKYVWVDPRTGEQIIKRPDGTFTPLGTRLRAFMRRQHMNKSNYWDVWVDREFVMSDSLIIDNPWAVN